jgi:hypothetical protein
MAKKKKAKRERRERRFLPRSSANPKIVTAIYAVGAALLGAGSWAQFGRTQVGMGDPLPYAWWLLGASAIVLVIAIWISSSSEPVLRVGDAGIGVDKNAVRRMAWHAVGAVAWDASDLAVIVTGKDEAGVDMAVRVPLKNQPQAVAWIVKEARARVPSVVDIPESALEHDVPAASTEAREFVPLDPIQVVGKHCAASGKVIAYEPDARVCQRCERVYHKLHLPVECPCGASLVALMAEKNESSASSG